MKNYSIEYNNEVIEFCITRKNVKNINLKVRKDFSIEVVANDRVSVGYIKELVGKKADWIIKSKEKIKTNLNNKQEAIIKYNTNDVVYYLGNEYMLVVVESLKDKVEIRDNKIHLYIKDINDFNKKEKIMYSWYRDKAKTEFQKHLKRLYPYVKDYNIDYPELKIRKMKSCWGTCHYNQGFIVLNTELIKYNIEKLEYVIIHELMHFRYHNHSKEFKYILDMLVDKVKEDNLKIKNTS